MFLASIKSKLILAVSASMIVLIVGLSFALFAYYERDTKEQIADAQFTLASLVANDIDQKLTGAHGQLIELSKIVQPELLSDSDRAQEFLDTHARIQAFFSNGLFLFSRRGILIAESPQVTGVPRRGRDFAFREYLATTLASKRPYISAPYFSSRPHAHPAIMMTAPLFDSRGDLVGVLGGSIDLVDDSVLGRAMHMRNGKTGYLFIFSKQRTMILHPDRTRILKQDVPVGANKLLDRAVDGFDGTDETINSRGLHAITSFKHLRATDWIVGVNSPVAEAYAPIYRARKTVLLVIALAIVVVTVLVWYLMNWLTRPLLAFTTHVESISGKEGQARRWALSSRDEIGHLARAFNTMLADLDAKQMEIESERERLAVTLTSIADGVMVTDLQGALILTNRAAAMLTGWPPAQALGKPLSSVFDPVDETRRARIQDSVAAVIASGATVYLPPNTLLVSRDGFEHFVSGSCAPVRAADGNTIGTVLVFQDVTEKRLFEEQRARTDKLESVGVLAGGIAHDFNNLLAAILGNLSSAREDASPHGPLGEILADTEQAALRARDLTLQLLTFSKGGEPIKRRMSLADIARASSSFALRGSNVSCEYAFAQDLWPVEADEGQMSQVVHNLVLNAVQAMPEGGTIRLRAENVVPDDADPRGQGMGRSVRFCVEDQGVGMTSEVRHKIFDPYFTTKERGTGLGLASAYSIVARHGGNIDAQSEPGKGSTFTVQLPAADGPAEVAPAPRPISHVGRGHVLLMDDQELVRKAAARMLDRLGYHMTGASDGAEALALYARALRDGTAFDAVILDLTVPGALGGKETIRRLQDIDPGVKAIVSSGYSNDPVMADHRKYGFVGVVAKPYRIEDVGEALRQVLSASGSP
jgi:PAS domain S-box-containing protein